MASVMINLLEILPSDVLLMGVCSNLTAMDIESCHEVSKDFRAAIKDESYSKILFSQHWKDVEEICADGKKVQYTLKDDEREGTYKSFHENDQVMINATYVNDKKDGPYIGWYEDGKLALECTFKEDNLMGLYKGWHENGEPRVECNFSDNGRYDGLCKWWDENGQLCTQRNYKNGCLMSTVK